MRHTVTRMVWRVGSWLAATLPQAFAYRIADMAGCACFVLRPRTRAAVEDNLRVVLGLPRSSPQVRMLACRVFLNFARSVVDFLMLGSSAERWKDRVAVEGAEALWSERRSGRPVVLVGAHLGPWELGAVSLGLRGLPLVVVSRPHRGRAADEFFTTMRQRAGLQVLQLPGAAGRVVEILRSRGCVGMLTDRGFGAGTAVRFFGRMAQMPWGAVACALRTGASLIPGYTIREGDRWRVVLGGPVRIERTGDWKRDVQAGMTGCLKALEGFIRRYPEQWSVFEPVWSD